MQQQIMLKRIAIIGGFISVVSVIIFVAFFFLQNKAPNEQTLVSEAAVIIIYDSPISGSEKIVSSVINKDVKPNVVKTTSIDVPNRLIISEINVNANIESLGLLPNGEMATPKGPNNVSWYNLGPKPGDIGNAVVAGHYGWKDGIPAVFDRLSKLKIGDRIKIQNAEGGEVTFIVHEIHVFDEYEDATRVFVSSDNKAHLNLITCGGVWDKVRKSYSNRLVVFSNKE